MNKIILIIKREYLTRVRKKSFIITTLLFPILYMVLIFGTGYIAEKGKKDLKVAIIDESGYFTNEKLAASNVGDKSSVLEITNLPKDSLAKSYSSLGYDGYAIIPSLNWQEGKEIEILSTKPIGLQSSMAIQNKLNLIWSDIKNQNLGIDVEKRKILETSNILVTAKNIDEPKANAQTANMIGMVCGFLIYFIILVYGSQVMMGVMEEKTNRIAEIIVSSVKPFQMMLGKIIGIGLVALTQFILWIVFILVIYNATKFSSGAESTANQLVGGVQTIFTSLNLPLLLFLFGFYFMGGFFFYASLYGAIGSAVNEDMREAQSLSFPITMLVIIAIAIMSAAANDPTGPIAFWGSIIPFTSPIVMMALVPYGVPGTIPYWQLGLSMGLLIAGFVFTTWFAGRIYRTGILMYGKKATWKELLKWAFSKA